ARPIPQARGSRNAAHEMREQSGSHKLGALRNLDVFRLLLAHVANTESSISGLTNINPFANFDIEAIESSPQEIRAHILAAKEMQSVPSVLELCINLILLSLCFSSF